MGKFKKGFDKTAAREMVNDVYGGSLREILNEQVRLALQSEDDAVRAKVCGQIVGTVAPSNEQGARQAFGTIVNIENRIPFPEYRMPLASVTVEQLGVGGGDVASPPAKPPKLIEPALAKKAEWVKDESKTVVHEVK